LHTEGDQWEIQHHGSNEQSCSIKVDRKLLSNPIAPSVPSVAIEANRSSKGWGSVLNDLTQMGGVWSAEEISTNNNYIPD